jgi:transcriptional/translational regulatory protein YebC/TACO1
LRKATEKNTEDYNSGIYEVYGHGSAAILVQTLTDNPTRAVKTIKEKVGRSVGAKFTSGGSVLFNFTQKAVLRPAAPYDVDVVLEVGIASNVADVEFLEEEQPPAIVTDADALSRLQDALLEAGIDARGELEYLANDRISLSDADREKNEKLIESLQELDDVDNIYHNIDGDI